MIDLLMVRLHDELAERTAAVSVNLEQRRPNNTLTRTINGAKVEENVFQSIFLYPGFDVTKFQRVNDQFQAVSYVLVRHHTYDEKNKDDISDKWGKSKLKEPTYSFSLGPTAAPQSPNLLVSTQI